MNKNSIRIFMFSVASLTCFILCALFSILCMISLIFVSCCLNLREKSEHRGDEETDEMNYGHGAPSEEDDEATSLTNKKKCCSCNCLLCPFVFYSFFAVCSFIFCALGLGIYVFSLCYTRYSYLVNDSDYMPELITQAYQSNPWLFDIQRFGISFYSILISFGFYLLVVIISTCTTCRIQMSPAWKHRHGDSYEVLQMQDLVINSKKIYNQDKKSEKEEAKKRKKLEKQAKKDKKSTKSEEEHLTNNMNHQNDNVDISPKTRVLAIDETYDD